MTTLRRLAHLTQVLDSGPAESFSEQARAEQEDLLAVAKGTREYLRKAFPDSGESWLEWLDKSLRILFPGVKCKLYAPYDPDGTLPGFIRLDIHTNMDRQEFRARADLLCSAMDGDRYGLIYLGLSVVQMLDVEADG